MAKWTIARLSRSGLAQRIRAPAEAGPYQTLLDEIVAGLGLSWPLFIALLLILPYVSAVLIVWVSIGIDELPTGAWRNLALPGVLMAYVAFAYRVNLPARKKGWRPSAKWSRYRMRSTTPSSGRDVRSAGAMKPWR